jgi:uncharacterized protein YbjQ (UPF0145 family)
MMVCTTSEVAGYRIVRRLGVVRSNIVRSRSVLGNFIGGIQAVFGGRIGACFDLAENARQEAFDHMCAHTSQAGANAIVDMRYDVEPAAARGGEM